MKARTNRKRLLPLFSLLFMVSSWSVVMAQPILAQQRTKITIDPTNERGNVNRLVFGANHRYAYNGFSMWDTQNNRAYPAFANAFRNAGITAVRFPGGHIANTYHWQRAIGPLAQRTRNIHGQTMEPLTNEFGPDEFARFIQQNGATGTLLVNFGTGTAQEAANWVEYMNAPVGTNPGGGTAWAEVRKQNGRTNPYPITYWEVGNEQNNQQQFYWMGALDDQKYSFGGTTRFAGQRLGKFDDQRDAAAVSDGTASQVFYVKYPPVQCDSQTVYVDGQAWTAVSNLSEVGQSNVYQIDCQAGTIQFGDGTHGNIPPLNSVVTIDYISGPHDGFVDFYEAMKAVDPNIKVCTSYDVSAKLGATHPFDCVVIHPITFYSISNGVDTAAEFHDKVMLEPQKRAAEVESLRQTLRRNIGTQADDVEIVVTEYNIVGYSPGRPPRPPGAEQYELSIGGALYAAQSLKHWLELGIPLAQKHSLIDFAFSDAPSGATAVSSGSNGIFGGSPAFVTSATALVYKLFTSTIGSELVASSVTNNPERILANGNRLSALQTVASIDSNGTLYLFVINRDRTTDVEANVELLRYQSNGQAIIKTLNGPSYLSYNTVNNPNIVAIAQRTKSIGSAGYTYTFPAHSVTAIKISGTVLLEQ